MNSTIKGSSKDLRKKVLLLYYHDLGYPMRSTNADMLYCFRDYSDHLVYYVNVAFGVPRYLSAVHFDMIIFHDLLLCKRSLPRRFEKAEKNLAELRDWPGERIAVVQDEFSRTNALCHLLCEHDVRTIYSVAPHSEWGKIYQGLDRDKITFRQFLTGYIKEETLPGLLSLGNKTTERDIDIGYRAAYSKSYQWGEHGLLKSRIADEFKRYASELTVDISTDPKDAFLGASWYSFLARCKYTLGVESGASVLDADGAVEQCVADLLRKDPDATFEEAKRRCFQDLDGGLKLFTISPRHFEACMTKTCQILVEGEYSGILKPWEHYIPIKRDFSNIAEVIALVKKDELREGIVERAYNDIVSSGRYTYRSFVSDVFLSISTKGYSSITSAEKNAYEKNIHRERRIWKFIPVQSFLVSSALALMPRTLYAIVERFMKKATM